MPNLYNYTLCLTRVQGFSGIEVTTPPIGPSAESAGLETLPVEDSDCKLPLQTADVAGDEEECEVVYDRMDFFATACYQLEER